MSSINDERFLSADERLAKLSRRQTELQVVQSELSAKTLSTKNIFVGAGPGSVLFLSKNPDKVLSQVEKELTSIKKKLAKSDVKKSVDLNF